LLPSGDLRGTVPVWDGFAWDVSGDYFYIDIGSIPEKSKREKDKNISIFDLEERITNQEEQIKNLKKQIQELTKNL
jgi:hypothetical protein